MIIKLIIAITLALLFYSYAIINGKMGDELKVGHVIALWLGVVANVAGVMYMGAIEEISEVGTSSTIMNVHGMLGGLATALMLGVSIAATVIYFGKNERRKTNFHRWSLYFWLFWLIPYIVGVIFGMNG